MSPGSPGMVVVLVLLEVCRALGIPRALVTCAKDNIASAHTILACGGVLEDERPGADGFVIQRYWVQTE